jgi:hypothetical protein
MNYRPEYLAPEDHQRSKKNAFFAPLPTLFAPVARSKSLAAGIQNRIKFDTTLSWARSQTVCRI